MEERTIYTLLLGSNMGDRTRYLGFARELLEKKCGRLLGASSVRETKAWGKTDQPDFLNQVLLIESDLEPLEVLGMMQEIEAASERIRVEKWGPRTLDIDMLFAGEQVINEESLVVPHPGIADRSFTLVLLQEIIPDFRHPVSGKTAGEMLEALCSKQ